MKRIVRPVVSNIITNSYTYPINRILIIQELNDEQNNFCAYTEEYLTPGYARDVEHFNPTLKDTIADGYDNWHSASHLINNHKGSDPRWKLHQPILYPTSIDLESRILYKDGYYIVSNPHDDEAQHLIDYVFLNDFGLPEARKAYIDSLKFTLSSYGNDLEKLRGFLVMFPARVQYRRAIETEFGIVL